MKESTPSLAHRVARRSLHQLMLRNPVIRILSGLLVLSTLLLPLQGAQKTYRIMPVGDSITEGGTSFSNWRYPLWEKLFSAGYLVEYVGSRKSPSRIGDLAHEGYGGKNSGFLAATVPGNFKKHPADVVLLHAGHNQFADQKPVPRIVEDTEDLIAGFRAVNPEVIVLLAQPITSAKLPKYSYIPELHGELAKLASRLDRAESPVRIVPQGEGFDPLKDTVADLVHPNESGLAKMADRWFEALVKVLENPGPSYQPRIMPYKETAKGELALHVFQPNDGRTGPRPAIVFFFGGGWKHGTPLQFYPECAWFAARGVVAISADYRTSFTHGTTPFDAVADGKSAIRWIRRHSAQLGIDPKRIVAAGASAGGQVAAATGTLRSFDDPADELSVSSRPDALALWYPVLDNGPDGYGDAPVKARYREFSPLHNVTAKTPPALVFIGTKDPLVPVPTIRSFERRMAEAGVHCQVNVIEGGGHPLYAYRKGPSALRDQLLQECDAFLRSAGVF